MRRPQIVRTRGKNSKCRILNMSNGSPLEAHSAGSSSCVLLLRFLLVARQCAHPQSCKCLPIFFHPKSVTNPYGPRTLQIYLRQTFSVPQVENEVKRAPFCGCCWDPRSRNLWIKEGPKRGIFDSFFRNCTTVQKPVYMPMELILNKKRYVSYSCVFYLKKNHS